MLTPYCKGFLCKMEHENRFWIHEEKFNHLWYRYLFFQSLISLRGFAIGKTSFSQIFIPTCLLVRTIDLVLIMAPVLCNFDNLYYQNIEVIFKFIYRYFIFIKNAIELCTVLCLFKIHVLNTFPLPFNLYRFWILFTLYISWNSALSRKVWHLWMFMSSLRATSGSSFLCPTANTTT